jgi:hypothetical protein
MSTLDLSHPPRIARVIDFETTGLPDDEAAEIVEAGFVDVDLVADGFPIVANSAWQSLVKPVGPIPAVTMAVHHIMPEDVAEAPHAMVAWQPWKGMDIPYEVVRALGDKGMIEAERGQMRRRQEASNG